MPGQVYEALSSADQLLLFASLNDGLGNSLHFASGSDVLSLATQQRMRQFARFLVAQDAFRIRIVGHTDSRGSNASNLVLSTARAETVAAALVSRGIASNLIETIGLGNGMPMSSNSSAAGRANNRRAVLTIYIDRQGLGRNCNPEFPMFLLTQFNSSGRNHLHIPKAGFCPRLPLRTCVELQP